MKHFFQKHFPEICEINRPIFWGLTIIFFVVSAIEYFSPDRIFFFVSPVFFVIPLILSAGIFFLDSQKPAPKPLPLTVAIPSFFLFSGIFGALLWSKIETENRFFHLGAWGILVIFFALFTGIILFEERFFSQMFGFFQREKMVFFGIFIFLILLGGVLFFGEMVRNPFFRPFS